MNWADAVPNFLIGLREGLEAGLIVSILLAALRKATPGRRSRRISSAPVWLGVLGAVMLAGSFAAVLTYSASELSSRAQEAAAGLLSVLAVGWSPGWCSGYAALRPGCPRSYAARCSARWRSGRAR